MDSTEIKAQIEQENKGNAKALLPIAVFLLFFLGSGVIAKDFYAMPTIVAFLIALAVAFCQNPRLKFNDKIKVCTKGIGDENVVMMCFIFLTAGAFSGAVTAAGGADSTVYLGLSLIPSQFAVVGLFLIGCFISISMGTSMLASLLGFHAIHVLQEDSTGGATARRRPPRGRSLFTGDIWTRWAFSGKMCTGLGIWASIFRPRKPHGARQDPSAGLAMRARHVAADAERSSFPVAADAAMSASSS